MAIRTIEYTLSRIKRAQNPSEQIAVFIVEDDDGKRELDVRYARTVLTQQMITSKVVGNRCRECGHAPINNEFEYVGTFDWTSNQKELRIFLEQCLK